MKRFTSILTSIIVMFSIIACFPVNAEETDCINVKMSGEYCYDYAFQAFDIINKYRAERGLDEIIISEHALKCSMERASEYTLFYSHTAPNSEKYGKPGDNCGGTLQKTPEEIVQAWMNSPAHRDIIMEDYMAIYKDYSDEQLTHPKVIESIKRAQLAAVGCFRDANGNYYWTFGWHNGSLDLTEANRNNYPNRLSVTQNIEILKSRITKWCFNIGKWYETNLNPIYSYDRKETPYSFSTDTYANSAPIDYENFTITSSDESVVSVNEDNHTLYFNNAGTATITASFKEDTSICFENTVTINPSVLPSAWEIENDIFYYDGKEQKPKVIYVGYDNLVEGKDFTLSYENNIGASDNIVEGKVILTGINGYVGKSEATFLIYGSPCMRLSADEEMYYSHSFDSWTVKYEPTCTQNGKKARTCSVCGKTEVQAIKATGHSFNETTIPPTCTEDGKLIKNCSVCGVTETEVIAKTGHSYTTKVVAPTCTVAGTKTFTCSCGDSYTESIPATGHRYGTKIIAPTCTEQGYTLHACFDCDDSYTETYISAKGHSFGDWVIKVYPGCTTNGSQTRRCTSCGAAETQTIQRLGHTFSDWNVTKAPTCTDAGSQSRECSVCGKTETQVISKTGHSFGAWTTTGNYQTRKCSACGKTETQAVTHVHSYTTKVVAPTCTAQGYTLHTCSKCNDSYKDNFTDVKSHSFGDWVTKIFPGCTTNGSQTRRCTSCGAAETQTIQRLGHTFSDWKITKAPTCTDAGSQSRECSSCGKVETTTISKTGHSYTTKVVSPTCTAQGYTLHTCSKCSNSYKDNYISTTGHCFGEWTTTGNSETRKCSACGKTETQAVTHVHSYTTKVVAPTCTAQGYTLHTCSKCNDSYKDNFTDVKSHSFGDWVTKIFPGCTTNGSQTRRCTSCGAAETQTIQRLGHTFSDWKITKAPTCTDAGSQSRECSSCGKVETTTISKTGHSYTTKVVSPTCTAQGYTLHTCSKCSNSYKDTYTSAKGHSFSSWTTTKPATCTTDGTKERECSVCSKIETATIPKTGHNYTTKVVAPTCTAQGYTLHTCSKCSDSYKDTYTSATGHTYTTKVVAPTYLAQGYTLHTCSLCGKSYKDTPTAKLTLANITKVSFTSAETAVKMSWGKVSGATGYRVYQYNTTKKKWVGIANTTSTAYTFKSLKAGTTYKFTVRAYKTVSGKTVLSPKYSTFTTSTNPATVKFTLAAGLRKATVKWSKVTGATAYKVYYKTSKSGKWKCLKTTSNKTTSYTKIGLTKGKTYYFTVKAYRTVGGKTYNGKYATKSVKVK